MILGYPQWQGIGFPTTVTEGHKRLVSALAHPEKAHHVSVYPPHDITMQEGVWGRAELIEQLLAATNLIEAVKPKRILTIGGDCSIEIAPAAWLNTLYDGDIQIFWLDAHADINTPETSFSGHLHGMPLGILLGEGNDRELLELVPQKITPDQIAFLGLRSIDPPEEEYIAANNIRNLKWDDLAAMPKKYKNAIIHLDSDVLDRSLYDECSTPTTGGTDMETLGKTVKWIFENYNVVGATLTEYAPKKSDTGLPLVKTMLLDYLKANDPIWG